MNFPTQQKNKEDYEEDFFDDRRFPLARINNSELIIERQESSFIKEVGRKIFSNLFVLVGGFFLMVSSALLFRHFFILPAELSRIPVGKELIFFFGGLLLMYLQLGKIKKKSDLLLYAIIPLMAISFCLLFSLLPKDWLILDAFGYSLMVFYSVVLVVFYYIKGCFESSEN